jgi:phage FluMu gp28-like protein
MPKAPSKVAKSPLDLLLPYQRRLADDDARFKFALQARQTGKDFASAAEGIRDCYLHEKAGLKVDWLIAAPSERQSMESLDKWKDWAKVFKLDIVDTFQERSDRAHSESLVNKSSITFPNGSRVISVPGRPDTVRGFSANILLTEFAFFEDPDKTWRAILPSITNPLRGGLKKCRLVTTPNGAGNKAHELWSKNYRVAGSTWSCHHVDIHEAVADGLALNVDELRAALDDPEGWAQEYELNFLDRATVLLPYDVIVPCENALAAETAPADFWQGAPDLNQPLVLGIDFGRKKDLTVCWALAVIAGRFHATQDVFTLADVSTPAQLEALRPRIRKARRVCFDYTGPGVGLGDLLVAEFGEFNPARHQFGKIELCQFTNQLKVDIFPKLRMAFDQKVVSIPISRAIREDLHSLSRVTLAGGGITYRAPQSPDGHADRATALALALRAASRLGTDSAVLTFEDTGPSRILANRRERSLLG